MTSDVSKLMSVTKPQIQKSQRTPGFYRINTQTITAVTIHLGMSFQTSENKTKKKKSLDRNWREIKHFMCTGANIRITSDFSSAIMSTRREFSKIFKVLRQENKNKNKTHQPRILCPKQLSFSSEREELKQNQGIFFSCQAA